MHMYIYNMHIYLDFIVHNNNIIHSREIHRNYFLKETESTNLKMIKCSVNIRFYLEFWRSLSLKILTFLPLNNNIHTYMIK